MKLLAIDSSGLVATVALLNDDTIMGEYTIHNKKTHSQTLLPMIRDLLEMAEVRTDELDALAVAAGPGSFTGLRIGAATAKGLAQALDLPLVAIPTLEGLAYNVVGTDSLVCPLMDARRNQAYYGIYEVAENGVTTVVEQAAGPLEDVIRHINHLGSPVVFLGDGVPVFEEQLRREIQVPYQFAPAHVRYQRASSVAVLGKFAMERHETLSAGEFSPFYLRVSQAERERLEREKNS